MLRKDVKPITLTEISEAAKKRVALISKEFADGFEFIKNYPRSVTFFGSARAHEDSVEYKVARNLAKRIVEELHYTVITGGGPGVMQAANEGAYEAGGNSIGLLIELPTEQKANKYITSKLGFHYFFSRKVCLAFSAEAYIFFPGGYGTLDEFTEILTLIQTNKIPKAPIILVGENYWKPFEHFLKESLLKKKYINSEDLFLYTVTNNEDEIINIIKNAPIRFGLAYGDKYESTNLISDSDTVDGPISSLSLKHCVPCEGDTLPMTPEESGKMLQEVSNWTLVEDKEIEKTYVFKDFSEAIDFMNSIAHIAEREGHHPDLKLHDYKKVDVRISTHSIGGLSENDFILASKIDDIVRR